VSLASAYRRHQSFFINALEIAKPDVQMHINALEQKAANGPEKQGILQEMVNIGAFNPTPDIFKKLDRCKCFPVKSNSGTVNWVDRSRDFVIVDRRELGELFKGKLNMLDLTLEEVHCVRSFLDGMRLQDQYLSNAVQPRTSAEGGSFNQALTDDLRRKSYAICR